MSERARHHARARRRRRPGAEAPERRRGDGRRRRAGARRGGGGRAGRARLTRTSRCAARRPRSRTAQARAPRREGSRDARAPVGWPELLPRSTTSSARSRRRGRGGRRGASSDQGHPPGPAGAARRAEARRHRAVLAQGRAVRPATARGAVAQQPRRGRRAGTVLEVVQPGYRSATTCCARPRVVVAAYEAGERTPTRSSGSTRRRRGRDQEGLPQAGAPVPPGPQPRRRQGRGALQGDPGRLRHRSAIPRSASSTTAAACSAWAAAARAAAAAGRRLRRRLRRLRGHPLQPLRRRRRAAARGGGARGPRPERGRDLEAEVSISFEQAMDGAQVPLSVATTRAVPDLPRHRRQAGHPADACARSARAAASSPRARACSRSPSRARAATAAGAIIDDPCPTCQGAGAQRTVKKYRVNIPAGVREGSRVRLAGKGEAGPQRRAARRPVRRSRTSRRRRSSSARATTSRSRCR